jgi:hypothetical protein
MKKLTQLLSESETDYKIYCDMDGVLVDFVKGYELFMGKPPGPIYTNDEERKQFWDNFRDRLDVKGMKESEYWATLPPLKDGLTLWKKIKRFNPTILSAPSYNVAQSKIGKVIWVKKYLGKVPTIIEYQKQKWADERSILIDDRKDFIDKWRAAGGIGIHHTSLAKTLKELSKYVS